jgi:hypothetical protein
MNQKLESEALMWDDRQWLLVLVVTTSFFSLLYFTTMAEYMEMEVDPWFVFQKIDTHDRFPMGMRTISWTLAFGPSLTKYTCEQSGMDVLLDWAMNTSNQKGKNLHYLKLPATSQDGKGRASNFFIGFSLQMLNR